ncbi:hypothetical protein GH721_07400 [Kriegella sp. EG-1]|nr:hypothetical protein [Flavobacteriaceae bacterium EG-1]
MKKSVSIFLIVLTMGIINGCVKEVKDALDDTTLSLQCVKKVQEFDERNEANPDRSCDEVIADINEIERTCSDILSESTKQSFADLREHCIDN